MPTDETPRHYPGLDGPQALREVGVSEDMQIAACPQCGAPAEVIDEGNAASTRGPVDIVRVVCVGRHWFLMARDRLPVNRSCGDDTRRGGGALSAVRMVGDDAAAADAARLRERCFPRPDEQCPAEWEDWPDYLASEHRP